MTRPAGRVKGVSKSRGSGRVGGHKIFISHGSGRVGSKSFKSRGSGRVGSGQEVSKPRGSGPVRSKFQISRVGSGRVKRFAKSRGSGGVMTCKMRVTRGSSHHDPRVVFGSPAGQTRGIGRRIPPISNVQLRAVAVQAPRGSDPRIRRLY